MVWCPSLFMVSASLSIHHILLKGWLGKEIIWGRAKTSFRKITILLLYFSFNISIVHPSASPFHTWLNDIYTNYSLLQFLLMLNEKKKKSTQVQVYLYWVSAFLSSQENHYQSKNGISQFVSTKYIKSYHTFLSPPLSIINMNLI